MKKSILQAGHQKRRGSFLYFGLLSCVVLLLILHPCGAQENKEEESIFVAKKAFDDGFYEVSLGLLERFQKNFPASSKRAEVDLLIGRCLFSQNKYLEALAKFESLLQDKAALVIKDGVLYWIAEVHFKGNSFEKAASYYGRIINEFPKSSYYPAAYYSQGFSLFQEQKFSEALTCFRAAEEKFPDAPFAQEVPFKILECLYQLKDYALLKDQVAKNQKVFLKDPARLSYLSFYLAEAEYYLNNFSEAIDAYAKVLKASRDDKIQALARLGMGWSFCKLKRYNEAEEAFSQVRLEQLDKRSKEVLLLGKAIVMAETARLDEAKGIYEGLLRSDTEPTVRIQAYLGKADVLYSLTEYAQAIQVYTQALEEAQGKSIPAELIDKAHYSLAWAFLKQGDFKEGIQEFQKVVKTTDDKVVKVSALCQIGDAYQDSGDYKKALEAYDSILKEYPDNFYNDYVQYQLGICLLKNSNYDGAIMSLLNLLGNYPESKLRDDASYALGLVYFQRQDYTTSKETFEKFQTEFKESPLTPQALYLLASSYFNLGKYPEAIEAFKNIIRLYGQDTALVQKAEYEIADCFYQMGDEKEAMERFKGLRAKYPDSSLSAEVMWWLGGYYYRHNELDQARRYFSSLAQDYPKSNLVPDAYYALGSIFEEEEKHEEAIDYFRKVITYGKTDLAGQAKIATADVFVRQEKIDAALSLYQETLKEYPNLASVVYPKMAELLSKTHEYGQALELYQKSLQLVSVREIPFIQFKIAEVLQAIRRPEQAIEEYLKVTYLYPENKELALKSLLRIAQMHEDAQEYKKAVAVYKRIVEMKAEESKYALERIEWITANIK